MCAERLSVASPYMTVSRPVGVRSQSVFWLLEGRGGLGGAGKSFANGRVEANIGLNG